MPLDRPHFLCIGAQKAATTWLAHNLRQHPEVWMPPVKELHYFDAFERVSGAEATRWYHRPGGTSPSLVPDVLRRTSDGRRARTAIRRGLRDRELRWTLRYLTGVRTDRHYHALFPDRPGLVMGEATPGYAVLPDEAVASLAQRLPGARALYLLRDPVDRAWSAARMKTEKHGVVPIDDWPTSDQLAFLQTHQRLGLRHSCYVEALDRWERHLGGRVFVGFYEDVQRAPADLLTSVYGFLDVDDDAAHVPADARVPRNARGKGRDVPPEPARWLSEQLLDPIEQAHARFANAHTARWLETARQRLSA